MILYNYLVAPFDTIDRYTVGQKPWGAAAIVGFACALMTAALYAPLLSMVSNVYVAALGFFFYLIFVSVCIDCAAQLAGRQAQLIKALEWLSLSYLPFLVLLPLELVFQHLPRYPLWWSSLLHLGIMIFTWILQVRTVRRIYGVSNLEALALWAAPLWLCLAIGISLVIFFLL